MTTKTLRLAAVLCVCAAWATAFTQDTTLTDALSGKLAASIRPTEIPDDFRPVKITVSNTTQATELATTLSSLGNTQANGADSAAIKILELVPILWSKGETVKVMGQDYSVFYGFEPDAYQVATIARGKNKPELRLKLRLIKSSEIVSITPMPEWTRERFVRSITPLGPSTVAVKSIVKKPAASQVAINTPTPGAGTNKPVIVLNPTEPTAGGAPPQPGVAPTQAPAVTGKPTAVLDAYVTLEDRKKAALQHIQQVASAILLYAQDYDDVYPYAQGTRAVMVATFPYLKDASVWKTLNPMHSGDFRFNLSVGGSSMADIKSPSDTPIAYDPFAWSDKTYLVAFADSKARFMTAAEWTAIKVNLKLNLPKHGKPMPADFGKDAHIGG